MKHIKPLSLALYLATIPLANWFINNIGTQFAPGTPHTIPVGFGYSAPSGVLLIGAALFLRDYVQQTYGYQTALTCIGIGIGLSYWVNPAVATASAVAFAISELADLTVFTAIRKQTLIGAVIVSGIIGGIIDSFIFLQIAFNSTQYWQGQVIGKTMMALIAGLMIWIHRVISHRLHTIKT
jgi:uncharacterized PurR-regulated membrane protein YhhQ (DUF165 family)